MKYNLVILQNREEWKKYYGTQEYYLADFVYIISEKRFYKERISLFEDMWKQPRSD